MRFVWDIQSKKYIEGMPKAFKKGIAQGILWSMVFAEEKAKSRFIQGSNADNHPPKPAPLPPPGPLTSRSGDYRDSIRAGVGKGIGWLKASVSYANIHENTGINEYGDKIGKRPMLLPVFQGSNLDKIREILVEEIVREMNNG